MRVKSYRVCFIVFEQCSHLVGCGWSGWIVVGGRKLCHRCSRKEVREISCPTQLPSSHLTSLRATPSTEVRLISSHHSGRHAQCEAIAGSKSQVVEEGEESKQHDVEKHLHYYSRCADSCCQDKTWVAHHAPIMIQEAIQLNATVEMGREGVSRDLNRSESDSVSARFLCWTGLVWNAMMKEWSLAGKDWSLSGYSWDRGLSAGLWALLGFGANATGQALVDKVESIGEECSWGRMRKAEHGVTPEHAHGEAMAEVKVTWVEAPKARGLALVCQAPEEKIALVVVRGTMNVRNALLALKIWPRYSPEATSIAGSSVRLHAGFAEVADELFDQIKPLLTKDTNVHLTGHSMGGAVSIILGMRLLAEGFSVSRIVAFGAPMVVWNPHNDCSCDDWVPRLPLVRVEHALDPVVKFPLPFGALGALANITNSNLGNGGSWAMYRPIGRLVMLEDPHAVLKRRRPVLNLLEREKAHRLWSYREILAIKS
jgi:pimeloyl-ACP methyl ester carboxylesterase